MLQAFRDSYRDARTTNGTVGARFWLDAIDDALTSLGREYGMAIGEIRERLRRRTVAIASGVLLSGGAFAYILACVR